jgi:hypothetical protein
LSKKRYGPYSLGILLLVGIFANPAFAEVTNIQTNDKLFLKGDKIEFSGNVETRSTGLVTIVIRDLNDEFVLLTQATINHDDTFQKNVTIENRFTEHGTYSATGFILNMTKGMTTEFDVSLNGIQITNDVESINTISEDILDMGLEDKEIGEKKNSKIVNSEPTYPDFVDSNKDPSHYIERYYSEPTYKSWFDRNYPDITIEEAVGITNDITEIKSTVQEIMDKEIIPEAQASSIAEPIQNKPDNSDIAQISLAIAGLGILFGAVYGVKRQVDSNSRQILLNKDTIRKKIIKPIIGSSPLEILQVRLAKGELSLEEFEKLESKLK